MIQTAAELSDLAARIQDAPWVGIDTEADSLHAYPEKLCLLQIGVPASNQLIDPLAGMDLKPLRLRSSGNYRD